MVDLFNKIIGKIINFIKKEESNFINKYRNQVSKLESKTNITNKRLLNRLDEIANILGSSIWIVNNKYEFFTLEGNYNESYGIKYFNKIVKEYDLLKYDKSYSNFRNLDDTFRYNVSQLEDIEKSAKHNINWMKDAIKNSTIPLTRLAESLTMEEIKFFNKKKLMGILGRRRLKIEPI